MLPLLIDFLFRWGHVLFGIAWIGLLYYFNFVQGEYFKEATTEAKADATQKLAPRALWWFRWAAMFTFLTGVYLFIRLGVGAGVNQYIGLSALMGFLMFLNVWLIIWPNQKIVCGIVEGDPKAAGPKALLASRTNTLFSGPMVFGMLASKHGTYSMSGLQGVSFADMGFLIPLILILLLQANALFGKLGPIATVNGVIGSSIVLTVVMFGLVAFI